MSRIRRNISTLLQGTSAILMVVALAQPALVFPDPHLSMVVVLDATGSVSPSSRAASLQYARDILHTANSADTIRFVAVGKETALVTSEEEEIEMARGRFPVKARRNVLSTDLESGLRLAGSLLRWWPQAGRAGERRVGDDRCG